MMQPEVADPTGLRYRAILEVIYATGLRRIEIVNLKLFDRQPVCPSHSAIGAGQ
jgi:integrase/recombinase XerD